jgi:hypothetical protein
VYIFAKIPFICYSHLLYEMAGRKGDRTWSQARKFAKCIRRSDVEPLLQEFHWKFATQIEWFLANVNIYRDDVVEHPISTPFFVGAALVSHAHGDNRIPGLTGRGLSNDDQAFCGRIQQVFLPSHPELTSADLHDCYSWIISNLHLLSKDDREYADRMIRLGLESGNLAKIVGKLATVFSDFINFFVEWAHQNRERFQR